MLFESKPVDPTTVLYIDNCTKKWQPFIKDVSVARQGRLAYLCERESKYMQSIISSNTGMGTTLKFIFPMLKNLSASLTLNETDFDQVWEAADAAFEDVFPPPRYGDHGMWDCVIRDRPSDQEKRELLSGLVERTHSSLLIYGTIVGKRTRPPVMG